MRVRDIRWSLVVSIAVVVCARWPVAELSAQSQGVGFLVAYGGGGSLNGALGVSAAVVSPPVALSTASDAFNDITDGSTSSGHTLIARRNGSVWAMGANDRGQLGLGYTGAAIESLTLIPGLVDVVKVVAAGQSSYAVDSAGTLWVWGDDSYGQLGIGQPALEQTSPVLNPLPFVTDVDAGPDFALATDSNGAIWAWGANAASQLGAPGPDRNVPGPVTAPAGFFAIDVAAGVNAALARSVTRDVMGWGDNGWHQIADAGATIDAGTTIVATGVIAMGAGDGHIVLARADGTVQVRGANWAGQLGNGTQLPTPGLLTVAGLSGVVDVAAGDAHSVAITNDGRAYAWGFNHKRQLLMPTPDVFTATPQQVMDLPLTARFARARSETTILLSDPGSLAIRTSVSSAVECAPFDASISITGFNASGGEPDQSAPGLHDLVMTLDIGPSFDLAGAVTADAGTVTTNGTRITWSLVSLDASSVTLRVPLRPSGGDGADQLFNSISYVSAEQPSPFALQSPVTFHAACPLPDQTPPVITAVAANPSSLSPPNGRMAPVAITVSATDNLSAPVCSVTGVTSNEPITDADWRITNPLTLELRASRSGMGNGRIYTIAVRCVDQAGNVATGATSVSVPKGKK